MYRRDTGIISSYFNYYSYRNDLTGSSFGAFTVRKLILIKPRPANSIVSLRLSENVAKYGYRKKLINS